MEKIKNKYTKNLEHLFFEVVSGKYLEICLTEQLKECRFDSDGTLDEKAEFYSFATKYRDFLLDVMSSLNEQEFIVGTFNRYMKNFIDYSNIKQYDAYNNLYEIIRKKDTVKFVFNKEKNVIDYVLENGFRYFSEASIYLPKTNIFVHPDEHCVLIAYGHMKELSMLAELILGKYQNTFGAYFFDIKNNY